MKNDWIPLDYIIDKWSKRKFNWLVDPDTKYISIRIDSRDDRCVITLRNGHILKNQKEFDEWFDACEKKVTSSMYELKTIRL